MFYNETLAPDQVDRLLEPKVLGGARRYRAGREEPADGITEEDNLLIKGNNLLALASLLPRYRGKVKCIYIDPPYYFAAKRDEDTFAYNVNFKLSSWLVFMRNRLELARELLRDDGAIFVQISDDGVAELHRLLKEIFNRPGENNFINKITVKTKSPSGFATVNAGVFETAEYILAFAKHKAQWTYHPQYVRAEYDTNYKWMIPNIGDPCERWEIRDLQEYLAVQRAMPAKRKRSRSWGRWCCGSWPLPMPWSIRSRCSVIPPSAPMPGGRCWRRETARRRIRTQCWRCGARGCTTCTSAAGRR